MSTARLTKAWSPPHEFSSFGLQLSGTRFSFQRSYKFPPNIVHVRFPFCSWLWFLSKTSQERWTFSDFEVSSVVSNRKVQRILISWSTLQRVTSSNMLVSAFSLVSLFSRYGIFSKIFSTHVSCEIDVRLLSILSFFLVYFDRFCHLRFIFFASVRFIFRCPYHSVYEGTSLI